MKRTLLSALAIGAGLGMIAGCSSSGGSASTSAATTSYGPIKIWYSNNAQEIAWGEQMVASWNKAHPSADHRRADPHRKVLGRRDRRGHHGRDQPCLIFNTSPASVPAFTQQGGLVPLNNFPGGRATSRPQRRGCQAVPGGQRRLLPDAVEVQPGHDLLQQEDLRQGRRHRARPTRRCTPTPSSWPPRRRLSPPSAAKYAIYPAPQQRVLPVLVRLLPAVRGRDRRQGTGRERQGQFNSPEAHGGQLLDAHLRRRPGRQGHLQRRPVRRRHRRHGHRRTVGHPDLQRKSAGAWFRFPPRTAWPSDQTHTFTDAKNIGIYASCKNNGTAWDFLKYATSSGRTACCCR